MTLDTFTILCNHQHYLYPKLSHYSSQILHPIINNSPAPTNLEFILYSSAMLGISGKGNKEILAPLQLAYFTWCYTFKVQLGYNTGQISSLWKAACHIFILAPADPHWGCVHLGCHD